MTKFIYRAKVSNETMKYTKDRVYNGEFVTTEYSNLLLISNDEADNVIVYKNDFDYVTKVNS